MAQLHDTAAAEDAGEYDGLYRWVLSIVAEWGYTVSQGRVVVYLKWKALMESMFWYCTYR